MSRVCIWSLGFVAMLAGCGGEDCCKVVPDAAPDAGDGYVVIVRTPVTINRDVDILWVIDDSPGMLDKQTNLKNNFPNFINVLNGIEGGFPNIHLGVVTSDLGTKGADDATAGPGIGSGPGSCSGNGKAGNLQTNGTALIQGTFISDTKNTDGTRSKNYTGDLASAFAAIASVGSGGCGFEQSIEAAKRALNNNPANAGFLRQSANLAVIFVSDEDDCSIAHSTLMGSDTTTLGPLQSFRCTRFGVTCDTGGTTTDEMNAVGLKSSCHSNESSAYLTNIGNYVQFFKGLKQTGDAMEYIAAIAGDPAPVSVELRVPPGGGTAIPALVHSCEYTGAVGQEVADPAVRVKQFTASFASNTTQTICQQDQSLPLVEIARGIRQVLGDACISLQLTTPPDCKATQESGGTTTMLPDCTTSGGATPCWQLVSDPVNCVTGDHLKLAVNRSVAPSPDTVVTLRCRL